MAKRKSIGDKTLGEAFQDLGHGIKVTGSGIKKGANYLGSGASWTYSKVLKPLKKTALIVVSGVAVGLACLYGARSFNGEFEPDYNPNCPNAVYEFNLGNEGKFAVIEQRNSNLTDFLTPENGKLGRCKRLENIRAEERKKAEDDYKSNVDSINKQYDKLKGN